MTAAKPQPTKPAPDAPLADVEWRVQGRIDRGGGVNVVAYLDGHTVARLLDEWVGPDRWRDHYEPTGKPGTMWCHLSLRYGAEWVTKEDLGTASDMEADKGLVSDAFKRVAMRKWGVGRNVFDLPVVRVGKFRRVERHGKDPMAYLTGESQAEIRDRLRELGFADAAAQTRVRTSDSEAASEPAGGPSLPERALAHADGEVDRQRSRLRAALRVISPADHPQYEALWSRLVNQLGGDPADDASWQAADSRRLRALADDAERIAGEVTAAADG